MSASSTAFVFRAMPADLKSKPVVEAAAPLPRYIDTDVQSQAVMPLKLFEPLVGIQAKRLELKAPYAFFILQVIHEETLGTKPILGILTDQHLILLDPCAYFSRTVSRLYETLKAQLGVKQVYVSSTQLQRNAANSVQRHLLSFEIMRYWSCLAEKELDEILYVLVAAHKGKDDAPTPFSLQGKRLVSKRIEALVYLTANDYELAIVELRARYAEQVPELANPFYKMQADTLIDLMLFTDWAKRRGVVSAELDTLSCSKSQIKAKFSLGPRFLQPSTNPPEEIELSLLAHEDFLKEPLIRR